MECVGTLSWSVAGLAVPERRGGAAGPAGPWRRKPESRIPDGRNQVGGAPDARAREARTLDAGPQWPAAAGFGQGAGSGTTAQTGRVIAPAARLAGTEGRTLELDWSQIVRRCMDGDSGAWAELVRTHHRRVYGLCYRFTNNPSDAEDLTQDVFLKVYSNLSSFDNGRGSLQVWITTMTRNLLVDNFRRTRNLRATGSLDDGWESAEELKPIDRLGRRARRHTRPRPRKNWPRWCKRAGKVSVELREAVILRDLQDLDYKEIAQVLAIPEGTVKSRISRGRAELARLLERNKREVM